MTFLVRLAEIGLSMSVVILLAVILSKLFGSRFSAKCRYLIWLIIIFRLCIPFNFNVLQQPALVTLDVPASFYRPSVNDVQSIAPGSAPLEPGTPSVRNDLPSAPQLPPIRNHGTEVPPSHKRPLVDLNTVIFCVWTIGATLVFLSGLTETVCAIRSYSRNIAFCDKWVSPIYHEVCRKYQIRRAPHLYVCREIDSPLLYGLFRPTILLPNQNLTEEGAAGVLAHELTHYRRGDIWIKFICLAAQSLYWFHPLVHLAAAHCSTEMELSCDEAVLRNTSEETRRTYGETLLEIIKNSHSQKGILTTKFNPHKKKL